MPKSIAHGCGNMLLQHAKELVLHSDLREGDKMLFYTTCAVDDVELDGLPNPKP